MQEQDEKFMRLALEQAQVALERHEVPIGAVVVHNVGEVAGGAKATGSGAVTTSGTIVGRGHNLIETLCDATAHAEMQALTAAANTMGSKYLPDCTLYVTVEPCPMCAAAAAWCQIGRIVYGAPDPKRGYSTVSEKLLHPKTAVTAGILAHECSQPVTDFFAKLRK